MRIPLAAVVSFADGEQEGLRMAIVRTASLQVTELVVELSGCLLPQQATLPRQVMVPVEWIAGAADGVLRLNCTPSMLEACPTLTFTVREIAPLLMYRAAPGPYATWPFLAFNAQDEQVALPRGKAIINPGAGVFSLEDRFAGRVTALEADDRSWRITALEMREGHWWKPKLVMIPVTSINHIAGGGVYLNQPYARLAHLPALVG